MPLNTMMVGASTPPITHDVDARWIMSYAAGLDDRNPRYLDTQADAVVAHPAFPVCLEWPVLLSSRHLPGYEASTPAEGARGVHAAHDLHLFRPIRAGERLTTQATVIGLRKIAPGAATTTRLDTVDQNGALVCRTYQLGITRDVDVIGPPRDGEPAPDVPQLRNPSNDVKRFAIPVAAGTAHVYTECARIWNPIHTDRKVALAAGLPGIILHGTATMALAVSRVVDKYLGADPTRVRRLGGRFTAMVSMPSMLTLEVLGDEAGTLFFRVVTEGGQSAFSEGFLSYD
jgi:acyl dehydratase